MIVSRALHAVDLNHHNRIIKILGVVIALLITLVVWQSWTYLRLHLERAFAEEQTRTFDQLRVQALQSDAAGAASCLKHVFIYYPSGSKQRTGSHLDLTVERHRLAVARDIIAYLRRTTGQDLGEKPEAWIEGYAKRD